MERPKDNNDANDNNNNSNNNDDDDDGDILYRVKWQFYAKGHQILCLYYSH